MTSLKPPFTEETARQKVKLAQALWNTKDAAQISQAYTATTIWRNRDTFLRGRAEVQAFLATKFNRERDYRLRKELFCFTDDKIAVQFWYEYRDADDGMRWKRCYGLEDWTFERTTGLMRKRQMSGNDVLIREEERWFVDGVGNERVDEVGIGEEHW